MKGVEGGLFLGKKLLEVNGFPLHQLENRYKPGIETVSGVQSKSAGEKGPIAAENAEIHTFAAEQAAEKWAISGKNAQEHSSGAEAHIDFVALVARLKSCPFKTAALGEFFPQPVKPVLVASSLCGG